MQIEHAQQQYLEEGAAFADLVVKRKAPPTRRRYEVIVVGGGQAGLATGYHLARRGVDFLIVDGSERIGDVWRKRWDSLRLFTPAGFDGLPGMRFPAHRHSFPTKDEMADYLEAYAEHFELPVLSGAWVRRLSRTDDGYLLETSRGELQADQVVVAMAGYQKPKYPSFAKDLDPSIEQIHTADYKNLSQLREGPALVVGAGNSGAELAKELSAHHEVWLAGRDVGAIPFRISSFLGRLFMVRLVLRFVFHRVMTIRTPIGRKMRPKVLSQGGPLIRTKTPELDSLGVKRVPKVARVVDGKPQLEDGRILDVANVVWCTGFRPEFERWIEMPIFDAKGYPRHEAGVVEDSPGLYFVGLMFLYSFSSVMVHGVGRDADRIAGTAARRARTAPRAAVEVGRRAAVQ